MSNAILARAVELLQSGHPQDAISLLSELVRAGKEDGYVHFLLGVAYQTIGAAQDALKSYGVAITLNPRASEPYYNQGLLLHELGRIGDAIESLAQATKCAPTVPEYHFAHGQSLFAAARYDRAINSLDRAISLKPNYLDALAIRGNAQYALGRFDSAIDSYGRAIALNGFVAELYYNRGNALRASRRHEEAIIDYNNAIAINPRFAPAFGARGVALHELSKFADALASHYQACILDPNSAEMHANLGNTLINVSRLDEAIVCFNRALALKPDLAEALSSRAETYRRMSRHQEAIADCTSVLAVNPTMKFVAGMRLDSKLRTCDWADLGREVDKILTELDLGRPVIAPFTLLHLPASAAQQLQCAKLFCNTYAAQTHERPAATTNFPGKIRVGYFGAEFHSHAVSFLTAELFERHDRSRFEVLGLSYGPSPDDAVRKRIAKSFDRFIDVRQKSDREIVEIARSLDLNIAVDLAGHTINSRIGIFAGRCASIQIQYLGFPGTSGADFIDYVIADSFVVPDDMRQDYSEKIIVLPTCFQVNDTQREIAPCLHRGNYGLPEKNFVYCYFGAAAKLNPDIFESWMKVLQRSSTSVLWLFCESDPQKNNLMRFAANAGIDPARLVVAGHVPYREHLARYQAADLVLDTLPFNGGTTVSDALWAGTPVLTRIGNTFAGRMASSLVRAAGLPDLVAGSVQEYEDLAVELAANPARLAALRGRLLQNRSTCALFDVARTVRYIEKGYEIALRRQLSGLPPEHIEVS